MQKEADEANERGRDLMESDPQQAELHFRRAMELAPEWASPAYNLGLLCKWQRRWQDSLIYNSMAFALDSEDIATRWNLGIAATAMQDWPLAAKCWESMGLKTPEGPGPWDYGLGPVPVRVNPEVAPEVVWCHRLDPARALILNVPTPDCGRRCRDVVLTDGQPMGSRMLRGREVSVFNELAVLEPSPLSTFVMELLLGPSEVERLLQQLGELGLDGEDWSTGVRQLCKACSEGRPHAEHDTELSATRTVRQIGVAAPPRTDLPKILRGWNVLKARRVL